jgi:NDP-sugar pyrophosphorylase family protein
MRNGGVEAATVCANSAARDIRVCLGDGSDLGMSLAHLEDWTPRGPGGCVRDAAVSTEAETFVVADGTTVPLVKLTALLEAHRSSRAALTIVVRPGRHAAGQAGTQRPTGVYLFDRRVLRYIPEEGFHDIKERLIPRLYEMGERVMTFAAEGGCPRVINAATYLALDSWAVERAYLVTGLLPGWSASGKALIHESAVVHPSARLLGAVVLGPDTRVGAGATIVGPASLGAGTTIGEGSVVSRSSVWGRCAVGDGAFVDRCLLTDGARVRPHGSLASSLRMGDHPGDATWNGGGPRRRLLPWALPAPQPQPAGRI